MGFKAEILRIESVKLHPIVGQILAYIERSWDILNFTRRNPGFGPKVPPALYLEFGFPHKTPKRSFSKFLKIGFPTPSTATYSFNCDIAAKKTLTSKYKLYHDIKFTCKFCRTRTEY